MNQSNQRLPCVSILFLLLIGAGASTIALWLVDHLQAVPNSRFIIAALVAIFLMSGSGALILYLRWREKRQAAVTVNTPVQPEPNVAATVYGMIPGREYQVMKSFIDHYGNAFEKGERLRFKEHHFLPYHGGYTILFEGRTLYLQEDQNKEILDHFSEYIALINQ